LLLRFALRTRVATTTFVPSHRGRCRIWFDFAFYDFVVMFCRFRHVSYAVSRLFAFYPLRFCLFAFPVSVRFAFVLRLLRSFPVFLFVRIYCVVTVAVFTLIVVFVCYDSHVTLLSCLRLVTLRSVTFVTV